MRSSFYKIIAFITVYFIFALYIITPSSFAPDLNYSWKRSPPLPIWLPEQIFPQQEGWSFENFSLGFQCQYPTWCDTYFEDTAYAQQKIYDHQHPEDCYSARFLVAPMEWNYGMGSSLHVKSQLLSLAMHENRTFIVADGTEWVYGKVCSPGTFECYFEPITHCKTSLHTPGWQNAPLMSRGNRFYNERVVRLHEILLYEPIDNFNPGNCIPWPFLYKDKFWWRAQATRYLVRPNQRSIDILKYHQKLIFPPDGVIPHPLAAIYVRHGDKWVEAELQPFSYYMDVLRPVADKFNITHVYVGTDDPDVIEQTSKYSNRYIFHYIKVERFNNSPLNVVQIANGGLIMNVSLTDMFVQSQGDVFVGTRTSNWCRLIDELRKTSGKARIPYLSPERPDLLFNDP